MLINKAEETRLLYSLNTGRPSGAYALMNAHANQMGQPSHGHPTQSLCIATQWGQTLFEAVFNLLLSYGFAKFSDGFFR